MSSDEALKDLGKHIQSVNSDTVIDYKVAYNELTVNAKRDDIVKLMTFLRDDPTCKFVQLSTVCVLIILNVKNGLKWFIIFLVFIIISECV